MAYLYILWHWQGGQHHKCIIIIIPSGKKKYKEEPAGSRQNTEDLVKPWHSVFDNVSTISVKPGTRTVYKGYKVKYIPCDIIKH